MKLKTVQRNLIGIVTVPTQGKWSVIEAGVFVALLLSYQNMFNVCTLLAQQC